MTRYTEPNVAAMIHRHPAPPGAGTVGDIIPLVERNHPIQRQTFFHWSKQIQTYHGSGTAGRVAADCRRYSGVYHVLGGAIQPHRLYIQRGGRLIAAPTIHLLQIAVFSTFLSSFCVHKISKTWYITVGAATCRPPRSEYNLCG